MAFKYKDIVPWGRNYDEYVRMFALTEKDLKTRILGCGDGPASFNYENNQRGGEVVSIDPLYQFSKQEIQNRINETYKDVLAQTRKNKEKFVWNRIKTVDELGKIRMDAMSMFLESYDQGKQENKYIPASLPELPFRENTFDIALSSHFLFLYSDHLSLEFHKNAIREMLKVAAEARIFPLLDVNAKKSHYVDRIISDLPSFNFEIKIVDYEFQKNGNELMIITPK